MQEEQQTENASFRAAVCRAHPVPLRINCMCWSRRSEALQGIGCHGFFLGTFDICGSWVCARKDLDKAAERALQLVVECEWEAWMVKKFHWMLHYRDSLMEHGCLIPCFAMERKHKQLTKIGTPIQNMKAYEKAVLEEVVSDQLFNLKQPGRFDMSCRLLSQSCRASRAMQELLAQHGVAVAQVSICRTLKLAGGGTVSTGDVVLLKMQSALACGILLANFDNGQPHSIVKFLDLQKTVADAVEWREAHDNQAHVVSSFGILCAVTYSKSSDVYRTLLPYQARHLLARGS